MEQSDISPFDWQRILMDQYPAGFLLEIIFRALVVFLVVVVSLRVTGRRGVKQLSLFELVFILTLGSAGGDAIFYHDVPLVPIVLTFGSIVALYFLIIYLISRNDRIEKWLEGKPRQVIDEGHFVMKYIERENFSPEEVCMELREKSVSHLGQVKMAILEASGGLSVFFYPDDEVRPGLSTLTWKREVSGVPDDDGHYSCARCGYTERKEAGTDYRCGRCKHKCCVKSVSDRRIT